MDLETGNKSGKPINTDQQTNQGEDSISTSSESFDYSSSDRQMDVGQNPQSDNSTSTPNSCCKKSRDPNFFAYSHPCSSTSLSSPRKNQLIGIPGYDPSRIPACIFAAKSTNPMEWSVASNESLFSIQTGNFSFSREYGLVATYKIVEMPKVDESVNHKTNTNLSPPLVKELEKPEMAQNLKQEEELKSEINDEVKEEEEEEEQEEEEAEEEGEELEELDKDNKKMTLSQAEKHGDDPEAVKDKSEEAENVCHSTSISCHSDTSNNSFVFPVLEAEDGGIKIEKDDFKKQEPQPQPSEQEEKEPMEMQPESETQLQPYPHLEMQTQTQTQPEKETSKLAVEVHTQSLEGSETGWFSCFFCFPLRCR